MHKESEMAAQRSAKARKTTKKTPTRHRKAAIKDLPSAKAAKIVGGIEALSPTATVSISPTNTLSLPGTNQSFL